MLMLCNEFKRALYEGKHTVGAFLGLCDPYSSEIMGSAGFDWLLVDHEHAPNTPASVLQQLQVLASCPVQTLVRAVNHDPSHIKQLLDIGVQNLMVPMVESASEAQALVRAMRYPPRGIRGLGAGLARASRWNGIEDYVQAADEQMCLIVQIESQAGVKALDSILAVEGVDAAFIGPSDLAASLGYLGNSAHPEVQSVIEETLKRVRSMGKAAGIFSGGSPECVERYREWGAQFLAVGIDTLLLRRAAVSVAAIYRRNN